MTVTIYKLTRATNSRYKSRFNVKVLTCFRCGKQIPEGKEIAVHRSSNAKIRFYCKKCYNSLYIDLGD